MPTILNAANEVAVSAFMAGRIGFYGISDVVEAVCTRLAGQFSGAPATIEEALAIDAEARQVAGPMAGLRVVVVEYPVGHQLRYGSDSDLTAPQGIVTVSPERCPAATNAAPVRPAVTSHCPSGDAPQIMLGGMPRGARDPGRTTTPEPGRL